MSVNCTERAVHSIIHKYPGERHTRLSVHSWNQSCKCFPLQHDYKCRLEHLLWQFELFFLLFLARGQWIIRKMGMRCLMSQLEGKWTEEASEDEQATRGLSYCTAEPFQQRVLQWKGVFVWQCVGPSLTKGFVSTTSVSCVFPHLIPQRWAATPHRINI